MAERPETVLITGGAGFIGSTLVRQWLEHEPEQVVTLDKFTYAGLRQSLTGVLEHPRHTLAAGDICDAALVAEVLSERRPQTLIHLAAETHVDQSIAHPPEFARTNALGTCALLDQATRHWRGLSDADQSRFRFVLISTDEVFGAAAPGQRFTADSPLVPSSPYAASKAAAEHLARSFAHSYKLPVVTVNPTNNYGPRQMPEKLIPKMILAATRCQPLPLYGDGLHERDWLHVDDGCRAIRAIARQAKPGERYLVGAESVRSNREVVEQICDLIDELTADGESRRSLIRQVADRPGHDRRYAVDSTPLRRLGWSPKIEFRTGLRATAQWYLENPEWTAAAEAALAARGAAESK